MSDIVIHTIMRTADAYMVAGCAQFFDLRDRGYFARAVNQNMHTPFRKFLEDTHMLMADAQRLLNGEEIISNQ